MPKTCKICFHPRRADIERTYADGTSWKAAIDKFKVSKNGYYRHRLHYLLNRDEIKASEVTRHIDEMTELLKTFNLVNSTVNRLLSLPVTKEILPATIRALTLRTRILETFLKARGVLEPPKITEIHVEREYTILANLILDLPEKWRTEIVDKLKREAEREQAAAGTSSGGGQTGSSSSSEMPIPSDGLGKLASKTDGGQDSKRA